MTVTMTAPRTRVDPGGVPSPPDPEVPEKAKRRRCSAEYKLAILADADAGTESGQIGALLRRERLYSSHLVDWRGQGETGPLEAWRASVAPSLPTRPGSRRIGEVGTMSGCAGAWPRPSGSSRSRETSLSCWGSRSTRPATSGPAFGRMVGTEGTREHLGYPVKRSPDRWILLTTDPRPIKGRDDLQMRCSTRVWWAREELNLRPLPCQIQRPLCGPYITGLMNRGRE
jgi:hypothetical protein